jgi:hypothetical protein
MVYIKNIILIIYHYYQQQDVSQFFKTDLLKFKHKQQFMIYPQFIHLANMPLKTEIV